MKLYLRSINIYLKKLKKKLKQHKLLSAQIKYF